MVSFPHRKLIDLTKTDIRLYFWKDCIVSGDLLILGKKKNKKKQCYISGKII